MSVHAGDGGTERPRNAMILSAVPGLGQLYNGQPIKALRLFVGSLGLMSLGVALLLWAIGAGPSVYNSHGVAFLFLALGAIVGFLVLFIGGLYVWASAVNDAYQSAATKASGGDARRTFMFRL